MVGDGEEEKFRKKKYLQKSLGVLFLTELTLAHQEGLLNSLPFSLQKSHL